MSRSSTYAAMSCHTLDKPDIHVDTEEDGTVWIHIHDVVSLALPAAPARELVNAVDTALATIGGIMQSSLTEKMREAGVIVSYTRDDVTEYARSTGRRIPDENEWRSVEKMIENALAEYVWEIVGTALDENN